METIKFDAKISSTGTIKIPKYKQLLNKVVSVTIVPKIKEKDRKKSAEEFINKFTGYLQSNNIDEEKMNRIKNKH